MLAYLLIAGVAFGISYWICSTGHHVWRAIVGFSIALVVGWVGGAGISVFLITTVSNVDVSATTLSLLGKGFWLALFGSGYGVYQGRKKLKTTNAPLQSATPTTTTSPEPTRNDAYAAALAEIEEGRLDKGVWARSFAESGGDESKAKALYIKARAESIQGAAVWQDTRPPGAEDAGIKAADEGQAASTSPAPVTKSLTTSTYEIGVWVILVLAFIAWWQYMEYTKRQTVSAPFGQNDKISNPPAAEHGPWEDYQPQAPAKTSQIDEFLGAQSQSPPPSTNLKPFYGKLDNWPAQKPPAQAQSPVIRESRSKAGFSPQVQADLNTIAARAVSDYPYLDTPEGKDVTDKILKRRNELIQQGVYPSIALTQAVNYYAPVNAPVPVNEKKIAPVEEKQSASPPGCRWVTPQEWSCK